MLRTVLSSLFLSFFCVAAIAQSPWRGYGFDDLLYLNVQTQPEVQDTLGQRILTTHGLYGTMMAQKVVGHTTIIHDESGAEEAYRSVMKGFIQTCQCTMNEMFMDTLQSRPVMRFSYTRKADQKDVESIAIAVKNRIYIFHYIFTTEFKRSAEIEKTQFYSGIRIMQTTDAFGKNSAAYLAGFMMGTAVFFLIPFLIVLAIAIAIYLLVKRRNSTQQSV